MENISSKLIIRGESVERIYSLYTTKKLIVNRRYQRKLVWTIEEKRSFIDSIIKEFPIPLILLAEKEEKYEIIDGMQRLDAITSFINGAFDVEGKYFDLETMAGTKFSKIRKKYLRKNSSICISYIKL